jgi:hypothetical protein
VKLTSHLHIVPRSSFKARCAIKHDNKFSVVSMSLLCVITGGFLRRNTDRPALGSDSCPLCEEAALRKDGRAQPERE